MNRMNTVFDICLVLSVVVFGYISVSSATQCMEFEPELQCSKSHGASDCDTKNTKRVCMGVRYGYTGTCYSFCSLPLSQTCYCDPNLTSSEACQSGLTCQAKCKRMFHYVSYCKYECEPNSIGQNCSDDDRKWRLAYENDNNGSPINGTDIDDLVSAIKRGAEVKVLHQSFGLLTLEKVTLHKNEDDKMNVYGQALYWSRPPASSNLFFVFSTEGNIHSTEFGLGEPAPRDSRDNVNFGGSMAWFVRDSYSEVTDYYQLSRAIQDGSTTRVSFNNEQYMQLDAVSYKPIQGYTDWEMRDILYGREFNVTEQWVFREVTYKNHVVKSSWKVNLHERQSLETCHEDVDWYVDTCWRTVFHNDASGGTLYGDVEDLISVIRSGQRIKVRVNGTLYETSVVKICDDEVTAQVFDSLNPHLSDAKWRWLDVSTEGSIHITETKVGQHCVTETSVSGKVVWFADTRNWTVGAVLDSDGMEVNGTHKSTLMEAYDAGADFRYMILNDDCEIYYDAYQVSKPGTNLKAYYNKEIRYDDDVAVRRHSFLSTMGVYNVDDYLVEDTEKMESSTENVEMSVWYIGQ